MTKIAPKLPHETDKIFLTDGGTETWLEYKRGFKLTNFSAFDLLNDPAANEAIREYYAAFAKTAVDLGTSFIFDSLTYRASRDWGELLGYSEQSLAEINHHCLTMYREVASQVGLRPEDTVISGCIGPKGDAYHLNQALTADSAQAYHTQQVETFRAAGVDMVTALTLNSVDEAIGIARAAKAVGLPSVISFTIEKNRRLRSGETLGEAINAVDQATGHAPILYMINCAHPVDYGPALKQADWITRIGGLRSNASSLDHGTLCQLGHLDEGDADELAAQNKEIKITYPHMNVFGGCCGTDFVHVEKIGRAVMSVAP